MKRFDHKTAIALVSLARTATGVRMDASRSAATNLGNQQKCRRNLVPGERR